MLATAIVAYPWVAGVETAGPFSQRILRGASARDAASAAVSAGVDGGLAVVGDAVGVGVDGVVTGVAECKS